MNYKYFFLLSGENPDLAEYELQCVLSVYNETIDLYTSPAKRIGMITISFDLNDEPNNKLILKLIQRLTLTHFGCNLLFYSSFKNSLPETIEKIISLFDSSSIQNLTSNKTFSIKTKRIGEPIGVFSDSGFTQEISRYIGAQILDLNPTKKVNLDNPDEKFIVVVSKHGFWFGQLISESLRKIIRERTTHKRPFFHPSAMNPFLLRTLINLSIIKPGEWLLDPFCGSGGVLIEAARLKIRSVGIEIDRKMIWGANKNLNNEKDWKRFMHLIFGDAQLLSIKEGSISAIVTDPPYGTAASTQGVDLRELLINFFNEIKSILKPKGRVVIAVPSTIDIEEKAAVILDATYDIFFQYVHRSLTRKILIFRIQTSMD